MTLGTELADVLNAESLRGVLVQAAPLILVGLGASLAFKIGFWNLGLEGQMILGGIFAAAISIYDIGPPSTRLMMMGLAAAVGGALWVLLVALLKIRFGVNEIIATLLLNYVAMYFLFHLLYGAWQDAKTAFPQSSPFRPFERLTDVGYGINSGLIIAVAARGYQPLSFASDGVWFAPFMRSACDKVLTCSGGTLTGYPPQRTG